MNNELKTYLVSTVGPDSSMVSVKYGPDMITVSTECFRDICGMPGHMSVNFIPNQLQCWVALAEQKPVWFHFSIVIGAQMELQMLKPAAEMADADLIIEAAKLTHQAEQLAQEGVFPADLALRIREITVECNRRTGTKEKDE